MGSYALLILAGALSGGFVLGLTGFGNGLTAYGFWLHALTPQISAPLVAIGSILGHLLMFRGFHHAMSKDRILPIVIGGLAGVPVYQGESDEFDILQVALALAGGTAQAELGQDRERVGLGLRLDVLDDLAGQAVIDQVGGRGRPRHDRDGTRVIVVGSHIGAGVTIPVGAPVVRGSGRDPIPLRTRALAGRLCDGRFRRGRRLPRL